MCTIFCCFYLCSYYKIDPIAIINISAYHTSNLNFVWLSNKTLINLTTYVCMKYEWDLTNLCLVICFNDLCILCSKILENVIGIPKLNIDKNHSDSPIFLIDKNSCRIIVTCDTFFSVTTLWFDWYLKPTLW